MSFQKIADLHRKKTEELLKSVNFEEIVKKVREIRSNSLKNLENLKKDLKENLQKNGIKVIEVKNREELKDFLFKIIPKGEILVKSKSNVMNELEIKQLFDGRNEIVETDCGDFIIDLLKEKPSHPIVPAVKIPFEKIKGALEKKFEVKIKDAKEATEFVKNFISEGIKKAKIGLSGANFISSDGFILITENEGNISLILKSVEKFIIIASIDKIVRSFEEASFLCKIQALFALGSLPSFINVIGGITKTADIENKLVYGMHGAKEIYLILVDNGRSKIIGTEFEELLYCINCGSCLYFCPVYRSLQEKFGFKYLGGRGIGLASLIFGKEKIFEKIFYCTTCSLCKKVCPAGIDLPNIIRKIREICSRENLITESNLEMLENVEAFGNPFGEALKEGKMPERLYCC